MVDVALAVHQIARRCQYISLFQPVLVHDFVVSKMNAVFRVEFFRASLEHIRNVLRLLGYQLEVVIFLVWHVCSLTCAILLQGRCLSKGHIMSLDQQAKVSGRTAFLSNRFPGG